MNKIPIENILVPDTKQAQSNGARDKQLWLEVLEKNSLYSALDAFEVINAKAKSSKSGEVNTLQAKRTANASKTKQVVATKSMHSENSAQASSSNLSAKQSDVLQHLVAKSNQSFKDASIATNFRIQSAKIEGRTLNKLSMTHQQATSNNLWLNKNTTVTIAHSAVEVWVRDINLTENKLSQVLNQIKRSMAHLGVSLSKVTINGKTAFNTQKALEV